MRIEHIVGVCWVLLALPAFAQDEAQGDTPSEAQGEEGVVIEEGAAEDEWARPRILLVRGRRVSNGSARGVSDVLRGIGEVVSGDTFVRSARSQGLPPTSGEAFERLLPAVGVQLAVVLEPGRGGTISVTYREGTSGFVLLEEEHNIGGGVDERLAERIRGEARLAMAVVTRPNPERMQRQDDTVVPGAVFDLALSLSGGIGLRDIRIPSLTVGRIDIESGLFPAVGLDLEVGIRPRADSRSRIFGSIRYATSVGLRLKLGAIGVAQDASSRSQHFDIGVGVDFRLTDTSTSAALIAGIGWSLRRLSTEGETVLPDYGLAGPRVEVGVRVPFFDGRIELRLVPEVQLLIVADESLGDEGIEGVGFAYGGAVQLAFMVTDTLRVMASYRESHARFDGARDVERWGLLQVGYIP